MTLSNGSDYHQQKQRRLSTVLFISVGINLLVLTLFSYWLVRERHPTPYFELKPADSDQEQIPLADCRNCLEVITSLQRLSYEQLLNKLENSRLVEDGFSERDLTLSTLIAFYHFDLSKVLIEKPQEKRTLNWKNPITNEQVLIPIYPGLTNNQFASIQNFARTERWPFTSKGMFNLLQKQNEEENIDSSLAETFILTPEFLTIELLFKRLDPPVSKQKLLEMMLEGNWDYINKFVEQQKQVNDLSIARRQKLLLDYIKQNSEIAAYILLEIENEFAVKKLDDAQVLAVLQLLPTKTLDSEKYALTLLTSPRGNSVWQQASLRLYEYAGEPIPKDWNYMTSLKRFAPEKVLAKEAEKKEKKSVPVVPAKIAKVPVAAAKPIVKTAPTKVIPSKTIIAKANPTSTPAKKDNYRLYIVQEGDSIWKISRRFGVDMEDLKKKNQLKSTAIKPGTVLKIP